MVEKHPEIAFMFDPQFLRKDDWGLKLHLSPEKLLVFKPKLLRLRVEDGDTFIPPEPGICHPVDQLHFRPEMMDNSVGGVFTEIEISLATMGQDQRHRTIGRSQPCFTGSFYCPPILRQVVEESQIWALMQQWGRLYSLVPRSLASILAPYGAVVRYKKRGSFNAVAHEQLKRLCWCAQEEIYNLSRASRLAVADKEGADSPLLRMFEPYCFRAGQCAEGGRYCGREISVRAEGDYFPERRV